MENSLCTIAGYPAAGREAISMGGSRDYTFEAVQQMGMEYIEF
jgi:hypothetical protein